MELSLKLSVPLTIAILGSALGYWNNARQNQIAENNQKDAVLSKYIERMENLILDKDLKKGALNDDVSSVARTLTLVSLSQLSGPGENRRRSVLQFLQEAGLIEDQEDEQVRVPLANANLVGADLREAYLYKAKLAVADLRYADLGGADLREANLIEADLRRAGLRDANLASASLRDADIQDADLGGADLRDTGLIKADLRRARLPGADLGNADLRGADLRHADLSHADLSWADLRNADLNGADLEGIRWDELTKWPEKAAFRDAKNISPELKTQLGL